MQFSERSVSIWKATTRALETSALERDIDAEVCVVGAGIAGLSVAYELSKAGVRVVVLDAHSIGGGETAQTTGHLSSALDDGYALLERTHGGDGARLAYESHDAAIERIGQIVRDESIACDFERLDGHLFLAQGDRRSSLEDELAAARRAGFGDTELLERAPNAGFDSGPCLRFPRQGQFHPLRYLDGLLAAIQRQGGLIFTNTRADAIQGGRTPVVKTVSGFHVTARNVVVTTNTPINDRFAIHTKQSPYRTFALAFSLNGEQVARALYWDTGDPYHYVRFADGGGDGTRLIVGGEDHRTGASDDARQRFERLERWTRERFAMAGPVTQRWSGQVLEPFDFLAYIGRSPRYAEHVFVATGDSGHGLTHGAIAGMLIKDLIVRGRHPWQALYDPARKRVAFDSIKEYLRLAGTISKHYLEWLKPIGHGELRDVAPGAGRVMRHRGRQLAVSRDDDGSLYACSAVCPHLGCAVHWNSHERSWDCPCHGSRFSSRGELLNGPAVRGLKPEQLETK